MDRTAITKIRLSNHEVMIENGRHQGLQLNQRLCPVCRNVVEKEQDFIWSCETLKVHRIKLLTQMSTLNTNFLRNLLRNSIFILTDSDALKSTGTYLNKHYSCEIFIGKL